MKDAILYVKCGKTIAGEAKCAYWRIYSLNVVFEWVWSLVVSGFVDHLWNAEGMCLACFECMVFPKHLTSSEV